MNRAQQIVTDTVTHATWMFATWATVRIAVSMYMYRNIGYPDSFLKIITDVEVHTLRFRWGWDLVAFVFFAAAAAIIQIVRQRRALIPTVMGTLVAAALSIAMAMYPALTLSGRVRSPFNGMNRSVNESIAFAVVVTLALVSLIILLSRARRQSAAIHPGWGLGELGSDVGQTRKREDGWSRTRRMRKSSPYTISDSQEGTLGCHNFYSRDPTP